MERVANFAQERENFLRHTIEPLCGNGEIASAFREVDRKEFVPESEKHLSYTDKIVRIDDESTLSQPSLVVAMVRLLDVQPDDIVLEIGTATGYQASVLSRLVREVHTIERKSDVSAVATENIKRLGYTNAFTHVGDGALGIPGKRFDKIIITAAVKNVPHALENQLQEGGILIAPVGPTPLDCILTRYRKVNGVLQSQEYGECKFVPLYSDQGSGWTTTELNELQKKSFQDHRPHTENYLQKQLEGTSQTYDTIIATLGKNMATAINREQSIDEITVLDLMTVINVIRRYCVESGKDIYDESILTRLSIDFALLVGRPKSLSPNTTLALYQCGIDTLLQLQQEHESQFTSKQ